MDVGASANNISSPLNNSMNMHGYMEKRGLVNESYKQRYFILQGRNLSYYKPNETSKVQGTIGITNALIHITNTANINTGDFFFNIKTPERTYHQKVKEYNEGMDWVNTLRALSTAHAEDQLLKKTTTGIEDAVMNHVACETHWIERVSSLHGCLHSADALPRFSLWQSQKQYLQNDFLHYRDYNNVQKQPKNSNFQLKARFVYSKFHEKCIMACQVGETALFIWTICEVLRILCVESERTELLHVVIQILEQEQQLCYLLGISPASIKSLSSAVEKVSRHPPATTLLALQKRTFKVIKLAHQLWINTPSCISALLHRYTYAELKLHELYLHAVVSCDAYRLRGANVTYSLVTNRIINQQGGKGWLIPTAPDGADVNEINMKSMKNAHENPEEVVVYQLDEAFWEEYELECDENDEK